MILFHGIAALEPRMKMLRFTIELYYALTLRNREPWHTPHTLTTLVVFRARWWCETSRILDAVHALEDHRGRKFNTTTSLNIPKVHDLEHLIALAPLRGPAMFHSCEA